MAYLGTPIPLAGLLFDPPHSLTHQSFAPADMRGGGTVNADGFGVGWYPPSGAPLTYKRESPLWSDSGLPALAGATRAGAILAAVRSATVGMPVTSAAVAPFAAGGWLFSHNGRVDGWPDSVVVLADRLPVRDLLTLDAPTDSALLWALVRDRLRAGEPAPEAVAAVVVEVAAAAPGSRLNLLLTDGRTAVATTLGHALSVRSAPGAGYVSSEPLDDDPAWRAVPDGRLVVATASTIDIYPLEGTA